MSENESGTTAEEFKEMPFGDLTNAARSAREQFDEFDDAFEDLGRGLTKPELAEEMEDLGFEGSREDGWTVEVDGDREEIDLLEVQTGQNGSSGPTEPSDATVLYCLTRAETTDERVSKIREAIEENTGFRFEEAGDGDKYSIVLPAEKRPEYDEWLEAQEEEEEEDDEEDEEVEEEQEDDESEEEDAEEEEEETEEEEEEEDEESDEEESEDSDAIPEDLIRERLNDRNKTGGPDDEKSVYEIATDEEVDGRSEMTKAEMIDAIVEIRKERGEVA